MGKCDAAVRKSIEETTNINSSLSQEKTFLNSHTIQKTMRLEDMSKHRTYCQRPSFQRQIVTTLI